VKFPLLSAALTALALLLAGCGNKGSSESPPADFKVTAADGSAIVTWTAEPDVDYWIFYGPGANITTANWAVSGGSVVTKATSPRTIGGLTNGNTYSFTINARKDGGPGGPSAPTQVVVPRLSGGTWTVGTPLGTGNLTGVAGGNGALGYGNVVVGAGGAIYSSINQAAWTTPTNPAASADLNATCYGTLGFVAAGANGTVLFSVDTATWAAQTSGTTATLYGCASAGTSGFIAMGAAGTLLTSANGTTWTPLASGTTDHLYSATFGNGRYVAVGANGTVITTTDGTTWTAATSGTTRDLRGIAYAALADSASPTSFSNIYVAVGAAGTVLTSADGTTWAAQAPLSADDFTAITYGGQFVSVGKGGVIYTSLNGTTWEKRTSGTTNDLAAVTRTLSGYSAVGARGTIVSSF
jgi:predicted small lipoprotein YifL